MLQMLVLKISWFSTQTGSDVSLNFCIIGRLSLTKIVCVFFSAFVKYSKILCISTPTFFDRFAKFPILTRLFLLWFVARKGRSFGSLQGIVGWCLRGRYWRRRKNSHQWKEHRCSLRGKFYPIREWHFSQGSTFSKQTVCIKPFDTHGFL